MYNLGDESNRSHKLKLIEVAIPLQDINREAAREKSIRYGHPSTLHLWWARRPLAACRAVLFAQLVDDPSAHPEDFPNEADQEARRKELHRIISELVKWENIHNQELLDKARAEIRKSCAPDGPPPILDPFAGGGSIPLEAQRLGLDACARDLNPVAVLINKALIEVPPKWAGHPPVFPGAAESAHSWPGATGLAEDVRRYGKWMRDEAERRIGRLYPKVRVFGVECKVIAWIWARTITCPNPACVGTMPLVRSFWLGKKRGKERYVVPVPDGKGIRFEIGGPTGVPREGTVSRTGAVCLLCSTPVPLSYIRNEGKAGRIGAQLMAIAAEGRRQRYYLAPTEDHEKAGDVPRPDDVPDVEIARNPRYLTAPNYGMRTWADLFTNRQLTALTVLSDLVSEVRDSVSAAQPSYADAIATYLSLALSRITSTNSQLCRWRPDAAKESINDTFSRQALAIVWDFAEGYPFTEGPSCYSSSASWIARTLEYLQADVIPGVAQQEDAAEGNYDGRLLVATDPPYYDNIGYADLSDFFYVWLRRSLIDVYPELMQMVLTPKDDEIVADPFRHGGKDQAKQFFEERFEAVFSRISEGTPKGYPISFFYAYKQAEADSNGNRASTGWETLLEAMLKTGWTVTGTWPIRTELGNRPRGQESNALASSIVLACRPRPVAARAIDRRGLISKLRAEMPGALRKLEQGGIAPVDLRQAAIGPGMAIYSRYAHVNEPSGGEMRVRSALALINQVLDEWLSQMEGDVTADTRWCVEWYKEHGFDPGPFGDADTLSKGTDTGVAVLDRAGVLHARGGKVTLLSIDKISKYYDSSQDDRISEWKVCLHLAKRLREQGAEPAAQLMASVRDKIDLPAVKDLAYLLHSIADENDWSDTALIFNALGTSWPDLEDISRSVVSAYTQDGMSPADK